jgi:hypothetical protein
LGDGFEALIDGGFFGCVVVWHGGVWLLLSFSVARARWRRKRGLAPRAGRVD